MTEPETSWHTLSSEQPGRPKRWTAVAGAAAAVVVLATIGAVGGWALAGGDADGQLADAANATAAISEPSPTSTAEHTQPIPPRSTGMSSGPAASKAPPPATRTSPTTTTSSTQKAIWKRVGDVDIYPVNTNLEYWAANLLGDAKGDEAQDAGSDLTLTAAPDQFIFDPAPNSALAPGRESFNPDDCGKVIDKASTTGLVAVNGNRYCIQSDVGYRYLLTVLSGSSNGEGLHVELLIAISA